MDFKDPTLVKIKQEHENIKEEVPDFVKMEIGEVKDFLMNKFEFVASGDAGLPNTHVKQEGDIDVDIKVKTEDFVEENVIKTDKYDVDANSMNIEVKTEDFVEGRVIKTDKEDDDANSMNIKVKTEDFVEEKVIKTEKEDSDANLMNVNGTVVNKPPKKSDHAGERPFKCDRCDKAFKREQHLASHTKTHFDCSDSHGSDLGNGSHNGSDSELTLHPSTEKEKIHLDEQSKEICLNVYNNLQLQNVHNKSTDSVIRETAYLTEIPYSTIYQLVRHGMNRQESRSDLGKSKRNNFKKKNR